MLGYPFQIINGKINTFGISAWSINITRVWSTTSQNDAVKFFFQLIGFYIHTDIDTGTENNPFCFHYFYFTFYYRFVKFHIRDSIHQKSSRIILAFKYGHAVSTFIQLVSSRKSGWTGTYNRYFFACTDFWRFWSHQSVFITIFDNGIFIFLNRYRWIIQSTGTCCLTWRRADTGSKFRKIICLKQSAKCLFVSVTINHIIPLRN